MKRLELLVTNGALAGCRFEVREGGVRLGRSSSNDIHIADEELSRNHCLFEPVGEEGVRVTDLASANGTLVNGKPLGSDPKDLAAGDLIEVGGTVLKVMGEGPAAVAGSVDLGLGRSDGGGTVPARRRSPLANILWGVVVLMAALAIYLVLTVPRDAEVPVSAVSVAEAEPTVREVWYEKVEASLDGIYRYEISVLPGGQVRVALDDTNENRHPQIPVRQLKDSALRELNDILSYGTLRELDPEYIGGESGSQALNSWSLKVVYDTDVRSVRVVNMQEPEAFRTVREKLEAFCNNELGVHALQYSREKLVALAEDALAQGRSKWADREAQHGNVHAAIVAFRQSIFYLDTVDPKPDCIQDARRGLEEATKELERRYSDQRFLAERALKLERWDEAQRELSVLLELVPDRNDDRYREASAKLVDVEKRLKGARK